MKFTIPGEPTGKARPRVTKWGTHNTEKTILYENLVKMCYEEQYPMGCAYTEEPICMVIHAFYGIPKSTAKKNIKPMLSGDIKPCKKPDIDNIAKIVADALNGVAYKDDTQIVDLRIKKCYGKTPRVEVEIQEV